jgi:hypothetical protein
MQQQDVKVVAYSSLSPTLLELFDKLNDIALLFAEVGANSWFSVKINADAARRLGISDAGVMCATAAGCVTINVEK